MKIIKEILKNMEYHLLWYIPLNIAIIFMVIIPNASMSWNLIKIFFRYWTWGYFISPSADLFIGLLVLFVLLPTYLLFLTPIMFGIYKEKKITNKRLWFYITAGIL